MLRFHWGLDREVVTTSSTRVRRSGAGGSRWTYVIVGAVIVLFVAGFIALAVVDARQQSAGAPEDVQTYDVGPGGEHTSGEVDYEQTPPVGGEHNPVWQNCGYYDAPVRDETAVHSLEHGAVWITYSPDLPQDEVAQLQDIAESNTYILVSPYPDLESPVVASAWGKQVLLDGADDPDLESFIQAYRQGPDTPEPGAVCTGGTSATL
jgi:Protein of unknown function (DUF3105)